MYGTTLGGKLPVTVAGRRVCNCNLSVCNMQEPTHSVSAVCPTFRARKSRKTAEYFLLVLRRPSSQNMHQLLFSVYNLPLASVQPEKKFIQSKTKCFLFSAYCSPQAATLKGNFAFLLNPKILRSMKAFSSPHIRAYPDPLDVLKSDTFASLAMFNTQMFLPLPPPIEIAIFCVKHTS